MPNSFAYIALLAWPLLAVLFYRRFDALTASFMTIVGGYMFLPAATVIDPPLLPALGKDEVAAISALIGCLFIKGVKIHFWGITKLQKMLITILMVIPFINVFFNTEPVFNGEVFVKGLTPYDALSAVIDQYLFLLPYLIGLSVVNKPNDITKLINYMIIAGLIYSLPALFEIRLSPQLHTWVYGFFPHSFLQQIRMDGFRPVVFMGHGLYVAMFFVCCSAFSFVKYEHVKSVQKKKALFIFLFLTFVLISCKTLGAIFWLCMFFAGYFMAKRFGKLVIWPIFAVFSIYPILSITGLIPYDSVIDMSLMFGEERYSSLKMRLVNEIQLLEHSQEKWFIGWGGWSRNRLSDTISDGHWIIIYSLYGFFYFIAYFSLFLVPLIIGLQNIRDRQTQSLVNTCTLIMCILLYDQLLNSSLGNSCYWFISGILNTFALQNSKAKFQKLTTTA